MSAATTKSTDTEAQLKALEDEYAFDDTGIDDPSPPQPAPASPSPSGTSGAPAPTAGQPVEEAPKRDARLAARAEAYGISPAEIAEMSDAELRRAVGYLDRLEATRQRIDREPAPAAPQPQAADDDVDIGLTEFDEEKNPTGYDPNLVKLLKAQAKEIAALKKRLGGIEEIEQRRADESRADWLDRVFESVAKNDPEIAAVIGGGGRADLDPEGLEMAARLVVLRKAAQLAGDPERITGDHIVEATRAVAKKPSAPQQSANPPAAVVANAQSHGAAVGRPTVEEWEQGGLARPTHRVGSPEPKGQKRAEKAVAEKMRGMGMDPGPIGGDEEDDLPD